MKRIFMTIIAAVCIAISVFTAGCSKYVSHYSAIGLVRTNTAHHASMSFSSFEGTNVCTLKVKDDGGKISYSANLEKGSAIVYYDFDGTKQELFTISAGESIDSALENMPKGNVDIIIETSEKCEEGRFEFTVSD